MSKVEVNQISSQCGSTLTIGQSGDTVTLACGATQTGFGRTGTVNWDTTAKTASFTAVSGTGYFVNTTSGAITVTMPASPSAGDIVGIKDYAGTFATNNVTIGRNGSLFDGEANDPILSTDQLSVLFVYVDGTQGWKTTQNDSANYGAAYVAATGGTITCCGDYKIHTFTSPGTFTVTNAGNAGGSNSVDYLVVAGGGGGRRDRGGGGGAGGFRYSDSTFCSPSPASPLANPTGIPVTASPYPITVGGGGAASPGPGGGGGSPGSNSIFSTITSTGGGGTCAPSGLPGGSGGGARDSACGTGGTGNTPPVSPPQGNNGADFPSGGTGMGGGGATAAGCGRNGGAGGGVTSVFGTSGENCGSFYYFSGGGGGGSSGGTPAGTGGIGGGGAGGPTPAPSIATAGTTNTGGGGGGGGCGGLAAGAAGGSGIVIIRYKYR